ncbi:DODA-type extradiol aromatic ring-opening family dioxygenase [Sphingomonas montanisoli]|uniref:Dioxygenase n=1 Tax=Sphingomonas montanisoli TaxID=2606412 RepID=A0A5D9C4F9_9SPHN|nr:class III extradiol ring-cleavage dioxygenase [Sphingomonas montanisoli]TZG26353.1 dioxygenase [Sphingomonas montanisoli]
MRQPTFYIPHGGGPCFFMDDPKGVWTGMEAFLRDLPATLADKPRAILIVSGHWETRGFRFTGNARPPLIFDYYNFPPHTYQLTYPAPGDPDLAARAAGLLSAAGFDAAVDPERGLDHGVFVPLKVAFPDADVPVVEMSLDKDLDPALVFDSGAALAPLRDEGVLIVGAGMSFHDLRLYGRAQANDPSKQFDDWLVEAAADPAERRARLIEWSRAPAARIAHPREEHLLPMMVAAGAASGVGTQIYGERVLEASISGFRFD